MDEFTFARQPTLGESIQLYTEEFLYRPSNASNDRAHSIMSEVLVSPINDLGLERANSDNPVLINLSYQGIIPIHPEPLPADKLNLEPLKGIKPGRSFTRPKDSPEKGEGKWNPVYA